MSPTPRDFTATTLGAPRIGPGRELKKAVEAYWAGTIDREGLLRTRAQVRDDGWERMVRAGLDSIPTHITSLYDQVLDTAHLLGALPARVADVADPLDAYFAAARGTAEIRPLEMTKWFDTNYHYLVPEISPDTDFELCPEEILDDLAAARARGIPARPVVIGPATFLSLAKAVDGADDPWTRLDDLVPLYRDLLALLAAGGAEWVQFDEPILVTDLDDARVSSIRSVYADLSAAVDRPGILLASYFGDGTHAARIAGTTDVEAVAVDLVAGSVDAVGAASALGETLLVAGVVDGRNVWRTDLDQALATAATTLGSARAVAVSTSCSTLHVPYSVASENVIDPTVRGWLAFATEKFAEVATLSASLRGGRAVMQESFDLNRELFAGRARDPRTHDAALRGRIDALRAQAPTRGALHERAALQRERHGLPVLPTTTIGSFPQTREIRKARADHRSGRLDDAGYTSAMVEEIRRVVRLQEELGLDVLVHGEPERNDMVQYFAELLDGFVTTTGGWVQSYGSRCVRPPILFGDVRRPAPMTVDWITCAQQMTPKPVKGMLTGPVTILAWSFVRDDLPLRECADQIALAIREETLDLQAAGIGIIQVDEPALRELLPLRRADQDDYLEWAVGAFRLATSGVSDSTQIHTHLCYSEFGEVIGSIAALDADVTSIEAARSHMEILDDLDEVGFAAQVGPGVYDIHSPRVPTVDEIEGLLTEAVSAMPSDRLWSNPDCGLKTRTNDEVRESLVNLVAATRRVRQTEAGKAFTGA